MVGRIIMRLLRSAVATGFATWIATWQNDPRYMALVPLVLTAAKWLREKYPSLQGWFPV